MQIEQDYIIFKEQKEWLKKKPWLLKKECEMCLEKTSDLDVYHTYYNINKLPWEYPDRAYITLCKECEQSRKLPKIKGLAKIRKEYLNVLEEFRLKQIEEWLNRKLNDWEYNG